jgi:hypothetical protein
MRQKHDHFTLDMFGVKTRGRPKKLHPMSSTERVRRFRAKKKLISVSETINTNPIQK